MKKMIRIGVAGLGFGAQVHVPVFQSLPNVSVIAILGRDAERVKNFAHERDIPKACTSFEEFFEQEMDAVSLALPPQWNAKGAFMALERGLPVLVEKPIAGSWQQAKKLLEAYRGKLAMVDFQFPELEVFKRLKKIIRSKIYGRIQHASLLWELESYSHKAKKRSWKTNAQESGGVVSLLGSHFFYIAEWLFGPIAKISACLDHHGLGTAPDFFSSQMKFNSGIFLTSVISNATPGGLGHQLEIALEKATVVLYNPPGDYMSGFRLSVRKDREEQVLFLDRRKPGTDGRIKPFQSLAERFITAIRQDGKKAYPSLSDGVRVQKLMEAVYTSSKRSHWISL